MDLQAILGSSTNPDGYLNKNGTTLLVKLAQRLKPMEWGEAFIPLRKLGVSASVELVIIRHGHVYLTWRDDEWYPGWHFPGGFIGQKETWQKAAFRIARRELGRGLRVRVSEDLKTFNNVNDPRFHHISIALLCTVEAGEPENGQWFKKRPKDLTPVNRRLWPVIRSFLA